MVDYANQLQENEGLDRRARHREGALPSACARS